MNYLEPFKKTTEVVIFNSGAFTTRLDYQGKEHYRFEICDLFKVIGYLYPVRFPRAKRIEVLDWCAEHAPNEHLVNDPGHSILFRDESVSIMFKLTFCENGTDD
jgi:hypothetical protein